MDLTIDLAGLLATGLKHCSSLNSDLMALERLPEGDILPLDMPCNRHVMIYPSKDIVLFFDDALGRARMVFLGKVRQNLKSYPFHPRLTEAAVSSPEFQATAEASCDDPLETEEVINEAWERFPYRFFGAEDVIPGLDEPEGY